MTATPFVLTGTCPRRHGTLVVRYARRDNQPFVGCEEYPNCRFTAPYDAALAAAAGNYTFTGGAALTPSVFKELLRLAPPDKWSQGQPATQLAHEISVVLNAVRDKQLRREEGNYDRR